MAKSSRGSKEPEQGPRGGPRPVLRMSDDGVRDVRCLQLGNLLGAEIERQGGHGVLEMLGFGGAHDGGCDHGFLGHPGERDLRPGYPAGGRDGEATASTTALVRGDMVSA